MPSLLCSQLEVVVITLLLLVLAVDGVLLAAIHHQPAQETTMPKPQLPAIAPVETVGKRWVDLGAAAVWNIAGCTQPQEYTWCEQISRAVLAIVQPVRDHEIRRAVAAEVRAELEPAIDAVRRLHSQDTSLLEAGRWCPGCGAEAPCPTLIALNGAVRP